MANRDNSKRKLHKPILPPGVTFRKTALINIDGAILKVLRASNTILLQPMSGYDLDPKNNSVIVYRLNIKDKKEETTNDVPTDN